MADEVARESEAVRGKGLNIKLEIESVLALHDLLSRTEPKGRSETRNHSKLHGEFNQKCREYIGSTRLEFKWKEGTVEFADEAAIEYLTLILEKRVEAGFSGALSVGYSQLLEAADEHRRSK
jgi:hypothetical protein